MRSTNAEPNLDTSMLLPAMLMVADLIPSTAANGPVPVVPTFTLVSRPAVGISNHLTSSECLCPHAVHNHEPGFPIVVVSSRLSCGCSHPPSPSASDGVSGTGSGL